jgi:excisionase family DNA binding protein
MLGSGDDATRRVVHGRIGARENHRTLADTSRFKRAIVEVIVSRPANSADSVDEDAPTGVFVRAPPKRSAREVVPDDDRRGTFDSLHAEVTALRVLVEQLAGPKLVTVAEAANRLGVSEVTIRRHVRSGRLPYKRLGRSIRVDLSRLG